ncbi:MAG: hypothetical protein K5891_07800 [Lachnospiraceae bacterium]|nr:hypothetical protein [Lachnospiraceae bacterium]
MNVNGVTSSQAAYAYRAGASASAAATEGKDTAVKTENAAAVYEPSAKTDAAPEKKTYTQNTDLVNRLKAETEARTNNLKSLVEKLISKQATTYGNATDIWSFLAKGEYEVDAETKAQAQKDISEDGYWGVKQTSERIVSFATALTGGDPDKIDEMEEAFKKGFEQAKKAWGGELPEISQQTYDAVLEKFEQLRRDAGLTTEAAQ